MKTFKNFRAILSMVIFGLALSVAFGWNPYISIAGVGCAQYLLRQLPKPSLSFMATVDITGLSETAKRIDKDLKMIPYAVMSQVLGLHGINLLPGIQNKDVITNFERKRGIARPYAVGQSEDNQDVGKAAERTLTVEKAYASVKDNINNYKTVAVGPSDLLGSNTRKQHPWEVSMLSAIVATFGEDLLDALFPGVRNTSDLSPLGCFDGFDHLIDDDITAGRIRESLGNIRNSGTIAKPSDNSDTNAFDYLLEFWRGAKPKLRERETVLLLPYGCADAYDSAYFNKFKYKPNFDSYGRSVLEGTGGKCLVIRSNIMGLGQRIVLTVPGNLDFGMNTMGDELFVQVRQPYVDPNEIQFWIQGDYGCRIRSVNANVFMINEGSPVAQALSGDYVS